MIKVPKKLINTVIILTTLVAAVYYFSKHRNLLKILSNTPVSLVLGLLILNVLLFIVLMIVFAATINLANIKVKTKENALLNAYSMLINFFIPGQAGPIYRGYYLFQKYKLKIIDFSVITITYFLTYGVLSVILVLFGTTHWWLSIILSLLIISLAILGSNIYLKKTKHSRLNLTPRSLMYLFAATFLQLIVQITIYLVELRYIDHAIKLSQVITYSGIANLALFVGLTPGAIGVRETFLILSEKINHITSSTIILANVIDRSVFILFLLFLGLFIVLYKGKEKLDNLKDDEVTEPKIAKS